MKGKQISCDYGVCIAKSGWYGVFEVENLIGSVTGDSKANVNKNVKDFVGLYIKDNPVIRLDFPLIIVNNSNSDFAVFGEDEESEVQYRICEVFWELSSNESLRVLELLSAVWRGNERRFSNGANQESSEVLFEQKDDNKESCEAFLGQNINWCSVIGILIYNMMRDKEVMVRFMEKYKGGLIAENDWSIYSESERKVVLEWFESSEYVRNMRIVCYPFSKLGFPTMYGLWRESRV